VGGDEREADEEEEDEAGGHRGTMPGGRGSGKVLR
jgi:hypothetical protein